MTPPAPAFESLVDSDGRIAVDLPCARCGYNLRTLSRNGACPECANPTRATIATARELYVNHARRMAEGAADLRLGVALLPLVCPPIVFLSVLMTLGGVLELTVRDPAEGGGPEGFSARRVVRWSLLALTAALVALLFRAGQAAVVAAGVAGAALPLAMLLHVAAAMRGLRETRLARLAYAVFGLVLLLILLLTGGWELIRANRTSDAAIGLLAVSITLLIAAYAATLNLLSLARSAFDVEVERRVSALGEIRRASTDETAK